MGYYTTFRFRATLKEDTPNDVIEIIRHYVERREDSIFYNDDSIHPDIRYKKPEIDHEFFKCFRVDMLFNSTNCNDHMTGSSMVVRNGLWILDIFTEFKNYDGEIEKFIDFISPHIVGKQNKYLGYWKGEGGSQNHIYLNKKQTNGK